jgi:hypothetical protein
MFVELSEIFSSFKYIPPPQLLSAHLNLVQKSVSKVTVARDFFSLVFSWIYTAQGSDFGAKPVSIFVSYSQSSSNFSMIGIFQK